MKIIKDGKGKVIVDFEHEKINVYVDDVSGIDFYPTMIFDDKFVSEVRNGIWLFGDQNEDKQEG